MSEHLEAGYRELTPTRRGERNGHYQRNLLTPAGKIERLAVPRDREGEFVTELFERYKRMTGDVEQAVLEMYQGGGLHLAAAGPHRPRPKRREAGGLRRSRGHKSGGGRRAAGG